MDRTEQILRLKQALLRDVAALIQRQDIQWRHAISAVVRELRSASVPTVIFGGTLRSLLLSRLRSRPSFGRPRDLDFVVADVSLDNLRSRLQKHLVRQTRFGGLKLLRDSWQFDVWPVHQTWAIREDESLEPRFDSLPRTTFFNLEAIAVEAWAAPGKVRVMYSGDDQFFHGVIERTIEINREENPFPALCVVRSLVLASQTQFAVGPRLAEYLSIQRKSLSDADLVDAQQRHYGYQRLEKREMRAWLDRVAEDHERSPESRIVLPMARQLNLWEDDAESSDDMLVRLAVMTVPTKRVGKA